MTHPADDLEQYLDSAPRKHVAQNQEDWFIAKIVSISRHPRLSQADRLNILSVALALSQHFLKETRS